MIEEDIILIIAWLAFYFFHSFLATAKVRKQVNISDRKFRLLYNIVAGISLLGVVLLSLFFPSRMVLKPLGWMQPIGLLLAVWGVWIINLSFRYYDFKTFAGLKEPEEKALLKKKGLLSMVRHPIYLGTLMVLGGYFFYSPSSTALIIFTVSLLYILIGIQLEERKLIAEFGDEYRQYCKQVPMLLPFLKF